MTTAPPGRRRTRGSDIAPDDRSLAGRLARVHLRSGMLATARAELEALVAEGGLDTPALADLAEARWRTGDLTGAGAAATAHLDEGGKEPIAMVVAAEALAVRGRTAEARAQAKRLLTAIGGTSTDATLEALFAGQPRGAVWPEAAVVDAVREAAVDDDDEVTTTSRMAREDESLARLVAREDITLTGLADRDEVGMVEAAISAGRVRDVAVRLSIMLRDEGARAPLVLSLAERALAVAATPPVAASLHLVCGDALRSMGREIEGMAAYQRGRAALGGAASTEGDR